MFGDDIAVDAGFALGRRNEVQEQVDSGCFASAVGAQQAENLARGNLQVEIIYDNPLTIGFGEVDGFEHGRHGGIPASA
jgi:hypothetical protein